jgi:outer membrane lipoprotein carrier protein
VARALHERRLLGFSAGFVCALGLALVQTASSAQAQPKTAAAPQETPEARAVAAAVQAFYDQTKDVSAVFFQTYVNKLYKRVDRSKGNVVFKKPGMMRWNYDQPNGKVVVSNGKQLLAYEPGEDGDQGQVVQQQISQAQLPQALAFLMGTGKLQDSFTFRLLDAAREGYPHGDVLELWPKQPTPQYERILFYVERTPAVRGLVRRVLIIDEAGNRNRFDFSGFKFNGNLSAKLFDWQPPKGTRQVKM